MEDKTSFKVILKPTSSESWNRTNFEFIMKNLSGKTSIFASDCGIYTDIDILADISTTAHSAFVMV